MKNQLLTLGNIVELQGKQYTVTGIEKSKAFDCDMVTLDEWLRVEKSEIKGVTITNEWLGKLGFERMLKSHLLYKGDFVFKRTASLFSVGIQSNDCFIQSYLPNISYIHQLQNIIHALTGETLEIEL